VILSFAPKTRLGTTWKLKAAAVAATPLTKFLRDDVFSMDDKRFRTGFNSKSESDSMPCIGIAGREKILPGPGAFGYAPKGPSCLRGPDQSSDVRSEWSRGPQVRSRVGSSPDAYG